ncbi:MAG TPA: cupredoxin domain-containing protein [Tepidiformaceae bacterium]
MKLTMHRLVQTAFILMVALIAIVPMASKSALADDGPTQITVKITDAGFDPATITVTQGASVELTFLWSQTQNTGDEHIIQLSGYNMATDKLDKNNTSSTIKFIATKSGNFGFACNIECDIHSSLQNGTLKVTAAGAAGGAAGGSAAPALTATKFTVDPAAGIALQGDHVSILGKLTDKDGQPVAKADVTFLLKEQFAGASGLMEVGTAKTGADGSVEFVYHPTTPDAESMVVHFDGQGLYDASDANIELPASRNFVPALVEEHEQILTFKFWAKVGFVLVIGGVWSTLLFILFQAFGISRVKAGAVVGKEARESVGGAAEAADLSGGGGGS